jgi:polysaccharide pyruvyl transferase WcaK-like protein
VLPIRGFRRRLRSAFPWIDHIVRADLVGDIRGGDSFSDIYGLRKFVVGSLPVISVIWLRGSIALFPQTYGPVKSPVAKAVARYILRHARPIVSRDEQSPGTVRDLVGSTVSVPTSPDVAFVLPVRTPASVPTQPPWVRRPGVEVIGLNVNGLMYNGGYTQKNMFGLKLDYPAFLVRLLEAFLASPNREILLIPHTFAPPGNVESDQEACARVRAALPSHLQARVFQVTEEFDQSAIKGVIGLCDFFVGSRMHACIAALSQCIPAVSVAYSKKFIGVFQSVGMADCVIDGRDRNADDALQTTLSAFAARTALQQTLNARVPEARQRLFSTFAAMLAQPRA